MPLAVLGYIMIVAFIVPLQLRKLTPFQALILVPVVVGFVGGLGTDTFRYAFLGMRDIFSVFSLLAFSLIYSGIMIVAGLFDPVADFIVRRVKGDPVRVLIGATILAVVASLDGDGTSTVIVSCATFMPVFKKLGMHMRYLAGVVVLGSGITNIIPHGGPTARIMAVTGVDTVDLFLLMIPNFITALICLLGFAVYWGKKERKRLDYTGTSEMELEPTTSNLSDEEKALRRPKLIWVNLGLTIIVLVSFLALGVPSPLSFALGSAIALVINYPKTKEGNRVIARNAPAVITVSMMIMAAGVMLGILTHSGMASAIADNISGIVTEGMQPFFAVFIAVISAPGLAILNNDAFYFGVLPALAETALLYGFTPEQIGIAAFMGQPIRAISPLIPALFLLLSMLDIDFRDYQKAVFPAAFAMFGVFLLTSLILGTVPIL